MRSTILAHVAGTAFVAAVASAQNNTTLPLSLPAINLGYLSYPHGNQFVAWTIPTPTTDLKEVCDTRGAGINGTATWTAIRSYNTYVFDPICRNPFNITDDATGATLYNLELACVDDDIPLYDRPEVTAVVHVASNKTLEACTAVPTGTDPYSNYVSCSSAGEGLTWSFACSEEGHADA